MATYKWCYDPNKWYTLYKQTFYNIVTDIKHVYSILGRVAKYLGNRCRRNKNLYDLDSAEDARYNLELINDCSPEANRLGISPHHHDSRHLKRDLNLSDLKNAKSGRFNFGATLASFIIALVCSGVNIPSLRLTNAIPSSPV